MESAGRTSSRPAGYLRGFPVHQIIIWRRKGGINFNPGYFLPTYEVIYLSETMDRYESASEHIGMKDYVRPLSQLIADIRREQRG